MTDAVEHVLRCTIRPATHHGDASLNMEAYGKPSVPFHRRRHRCTSVSVVCWSSSSSSSCSP